MYTFLIVCDAMGCHHHHKVETIDFSYTRLKVIALRIDFSSTNPMQIILNLPDELVQHFNRDHLAREILEALVIQAYQVEKITSAEVGRILELPSRWAVDDFLKQHNADLHYDETDLERDCEALRQLRVKYTNSAS